MSPEPKQPVAVSTKPTRQVTTPIVQPNRRSKKTLAIIMVLALLTATSSGVAIYFYTQYQDLAKNPTKLVDNENKALVAKIGTLMVLPGDETPTVATVTDLAPLKDQPFFTNAKIGYKVVIYTNAKRAILYDPVLSKIVEVAPLNIGQNTPPAKTTLPAENTNTNTPR